MKQYVMFMETQQVVFFSALILWPVRDFVLSTPGREIK